MFVSRSVHSDHSDLIHDVAYDYYGQRMATCSSDQMIKIWDLRDDQEWECTARWRYHLGSIWRVCWAHPEFGQIIATCSFDRTIAIWEEIAGQEGVVNAGGGGANREGQELSSGSGGGGTGGTTNSRGGVWIRRAHLVDPRSSVTGLMFAPRFLGLQLAAISTDGVLLVYEAQDVMNLCQWTVQCDFATNMTGSCLAWSQSRIDPSLIAVGSAATNEKTSNQSGGDHGEPGSHLANREAASDQLTAGSSAPTTSRGKLILLEYNEVSRRWNLVQDVVDIKDAVYDVAFAPSMGQSYQTLAVGSENLLILLIKSTNPSQQETGSNAPGAYDVSVMARFDNAGGRVSRVSWNFQGNILASAGDDGTVRLWCSNYLKAWFPLSVIRPGEISLPLPPSHLSATAAMATATAAAASMPRNPTGGLTLGSAVASAAEGLQKAAASGATESRGESLASIASAVSAGNQGPVRFKKSGSTAYTSNQAVWH